MEKQQIEPEKLMTFGDKVEVFITLLIVITIISLGAIAFNHMWGHLGETNNNNLITSPESMTALFQSVSTLQKDYNNLYSLYVTDTCKRNGGIYISKQDQFDEAYTELQKEYPGATIINFPEQDNDFKPVCDVKGEKYLLVDDIWTSSTETVKTLTK